MAGCPRQASGQGSEQNCPRLRQSVIFQRNKTRKSPRPWPVLFYSCLTVTNPISRHFKITKAQQPQETSSGCTQLVSVQAKPNQIMTGLQTGPQTWGTFPSLEVFSFSLRSKENSQNRWFRDTGGFLWSLLVLPARTPPNSEKYLIPSRIDHLWFSLPGGGFY